MNGLGGIGQQVGSELIGVAKKAVEETAKVGVSIAKGTVESVTGGTTSSVTTPPGGQADTSGEGVGASDPNAAAKAQKKAAERRRIAELDAELIAFIKKRDQERAQKEQVQEEQKMEELQKKKSEKAQRDQDLIRSTQRQYGGTGEAAKKQY